MSNFSMSNAPQPMPAQKRLRFSLIVSLAFLAFAISVTAYVLFAAPSSGTHQVTRQQHPYTKARTEGQPLTTHRMLSTAPVQAPTSMMPWNVTFDLRHGYVWVAEPGCEPVPRCPTTMAGALGQYSYADGSFIQDINTPAGYSSPFFITADANGIVWFTEPNSDAIGQYDPQSGTWHQWPVKKGSTPYDLVLDARGNLWFTEYTANSIGFLNTKTHVLVETPITTPNSQPYGISIDTHGTVWFAENATNVNQIGSFASTPSGAIRISEHPVNAVHPHLITVASDGIVWFSEGFAGSLGMFDPANGQSKSIVVFAGTCTPTNCTGTHISSVHVDVHGNVWFTDSLSQRVGYLVPATGQVVARTLNANVHPHDGLNIDPSGRLWFTEQDALMLIMWPPSAV